MRQLRAVFGKALSKSVEAFREIDVEELYPTLSDSQKKNAADMCKQLIANMRDNMEREFDEIVEKTRVCEQLNTLDKLIVQQSKMKTGGRRRPAIGPNPLETLHDKILDLKRAKRDALSKKLAACQEEIKQLETKKAELSSVEKENNRNLTSILAKVSSTRTA